ncbi:hypothetical protein CCMA1212_005129 [Trichoderma ghanense]|uniref:Uncharacterized protein n=1 Tax=Trichoderma ghanense TaxID=65468 RepID=A0ABY2H4M7_9HYPO
MCPREHVRLPLLLGEDGTLLLALASDARRESAAADERGNDDDDDGGAQVLAAEDAAQFDDLGGASPVPEEDNEVDSFFGDNNEGSRYREFVIRLAATQPLGDEREGVSMLPELSDGSSSDEEGWSSSLGYLSSVNEADVEDNEPGVVDEESDEEEEEQGYVLLHSATEAMAAEMDPPDWMDAANDYLLEAYDFPPLERQNR